jgi:gluconokinase
MLDKIRLQQAGRLPAVYQASLGDGRPLQFDARCCRFLGVSYAEVVRMTLVGGSDEQVLEKLHATGVTRTDDECNVWNRFMMKIGWRDDRQAVLQQRIVEYGLAGKPIETFFDLLDFDEGRDPIAARSWEVRPAMVILIMGVAGSGKTTVGRMLADGLGWRFNDADDFHPPANVAKMAAGIPLDDTDRAPWLAAIRAHIETCLHTGENAVVTCSALKEKYRQIVLPDPTTVKLVYLKGSRELLWERINSRHGHFMKPQMLDSQLDALEEPAHALVADIAQDPGQIVALIRSTYHI